MIRVLPSFVLVVLLGVGVQRTEAQIMKRPGDCIPMANTHSREFVESDFESKESPVTYTILAPSMKVGIVDLPKGVQIRSCGSFEQYSEYVGHFVGGVRFSFVQDGIRLKSYLDKPDGTTEVLPGMRFHSTGRVSSGVLDQDLVLNHFQSWERTEKGMGKEKPAVLAMNTPVYFGPDGKVYKGTLKEDRYILSRHLTILRAVFPGNLFNDSRYQDEVSFSEYRSYESRAPSFFGDHKVSEMFPLSGGKEFELYTSEKVANVVGLRSGTSFKDLKIGNIGVPANSEFGVTPAGFLEYVRPSADLKVGDKVLVKGTKFWSNTGLNLSSTLAEYPVDTSKVSKITCSNENCLFLVDKPIEVGGFFFKPGCKVRYRMSDKIVSQFACSEPIEFRNYSIVSYGARAHRVDIEAVDPEVWDTKFEGQVKIELKPASFEPMQIYVRSGFWKFNKVWVPESGGERLKRENLVSADALKAIGFLTAEREEAKASDYFQVGHWYPICHPDQEVSSFDQPAGKSLSKFVSCDQITLQTDGWASLVKVEKRQDGWIGVRRFRVRHDGEMAGEERLEWLQEKNLLSSYYLEVGNSKIPLPFTSYPQVKSINGDTITVTGEVGFCFAAMPAIVLITMKKDALKSVDRSRIVIKFLSSEQKLMCRT